MSIQRPLRLRDMDPKLLRKAAPPAAPRIEEKPQEYIKPTRDVFPILGEGGEATAYGVVYPLKADKTLESQKYQLGLGAHTPEWLHPAKACVITVLAGTGVLYQSHDEGTEIAAGSVYHIEPNVPFSILATSRMAFLSIREHGYKARMKENISTIREPAIPIDVLDISGGASVNAVERSSKAVEQLIASRPSRDENGNLNTVSTGNPLANVLASLGISEV